MLLLAADGCAQTTRTPALEVRKAYVEGNEQASLVVDLEFSPAPQVLDALANGVPVRLEFFLGGRDASNRVAFDRRVLELSYQPLLRRWQLRRNDSESPRLFSSRAQLLAAMDQVRLPLGDDWKLLKGAREYSLRVRLPPSSLPGPLRLPAWFSRTWRIDSGEVMWTSAG